MTDRQIISLLKRYMDGATTVEEETALTEFFCTATDADRPDAISAADWSAYREMFCMFAPERAEKDLQNEAAAPTMQRFTLRKAALWVTSVAAVAVLCLLFWHCFLTIRRLVSRRVRRWLSKQLALCLSILSPTAFLPNSRSVFSQTA